jgi:hypothetical protein
LTQPCLSNLCDKRGAGREIVPTSIATSKIVL